VLKVVSGTAFDRPCGDRDGSPNGATVDVTDTTRIDGRLGGLGSVAAVEAALGAGHAVRAEGLATLVSVTEFDALLIRFQSGAVHP